MAISAVAAGASVCLVVVGGVYTIKGDTRVLKERADGTDRVLAKMDKQIEKMDGVLVVLAESKGRTDLIDQRVAMQGARVDDLTRRFNDWSDSRDPNLCPAHVGR